jgi:hypothetical protein
VFGENDPLCFPTVFVRSFATNGLPFEVDWSESCIDRIQIGLRSARAGEFMDNPPQDLRLRFSSNGVVPGFVAVIPLALGIGANGGGAVLAGGHAQ